MAPVRGTGKRAGIAAVTLLVAGAGWLAWSRLGPDPTAPRAVFLVVVDTLRPDRLSCYEGDGPETPAIDAFARGGVRFVDAKASASWTVPSVGALLTSRYPTQLGLVEKPLAEGEHVEWRDVREQGSLRLPEGVETLAQVLDDAGFRTAAFVNQPGLIANDSFTHGFDDWYYPETPEEIRRYDGSPLRKGRRWAPYLTTAGAIDDSLIREFGSWLRRERTGRVFAWIHLLTPHSPYLPPKEQRPPGPPRPEDSGPSALYDAEVVSVDEKFREILRLIEETVGLDRSLIVLTSDHGEAFGEHGMTEHGHTLHGEVLRVPLVMDGPGLPDGATVEGPVPGIAVMPTIVDLAVGADAIPADVEGTSLRDAIRSGEAPDTPVYAEAMLYGSTERAWIEDGYKLLYDRQANVYELFDVASDPGETSDLSRRQPDRAEEMARRMTAHHERLLRDRARGTPADDAEGQEQALEALRALGYVK